MANTAEIQHCEDCENCILYEADVSLSRCELHAIEGTKYRISGSIPKAKQFCFVIRISDTCENYKAKVEEELNNG